jgi:hypothetical protein
MEVLHSVFSNGRHTEHFRRPWNLIDASELGSIVQHVEAEMLTLPTDLILLLFTL